MQTEIVHDDDFAGTQIRHPHAIDMGLETAAVDRAIQHHGRDDAGQPEACDEGRGFPVSVPDSGS